MMQAEWIGLPTCFKLALSGCGMNMGEGYRDKWIEKQKDDTLDQIKWQSFRVRTASVQVCV